LLVLAYTIGGLLAAAGIVLSLLYTGSALATTAIGTLIPVLSDTGDLRTRFGGYLLAAGAVGEFGPILLLTLILSGESTLRNGLNLIAFIVLAVLVAVLAVRSSERTMPLLERTLESSSQPAVRWIIVLVFALAMLAFELGLDPLLGGFAFGGALFASVSGVLKMLAFFLIFLLVRGTPALVLYRRVMDRRERIALALMSSTQLPLVLAITTLATESGHMLPSTAAALVGAAVLSTLVFPAVGLRLRGDLEAERLLAQA
jgi:Kef-type K+ transport system membrane component KefB